MSVVAAGAVEELDAILHRDIAEGEAWRRWAAGLMEPEVLRPDLLMALAGAIRRFDPMLDAYLDTPLAAPGRTVIVSGSGKETFKTFNVSTAAGILAASAGVPVVKGVSRSVSAVSGAADVLEALGVPVLNSPEDVAVGLERQGIAFISYAAFCPSYAGRYDGVFGTLTPFSFFMPAVVLAVAAAGFVHGIADTRTGLSAQAISGIRPDLDRGVVVATQPMAGRVMDEYAPYGTAHSTELVGRSRRTSCESATPASPAWLDAVAHGRSHAVNAKLVLGALHPETSGPGSELVEHNAALIIQVAYGDDTSRADALELARCARSSGSAVSLLSRIRTPFEAGAHAREP